MSHHFPMASTARDFQWFPQPRPPLRFPWDPLRLIEIPGATGMALSAESQVHSLNKSCSSAKSPSFAGTKLSTAPPRTGAGAAVGIPGALPWNQEIRFKDYSFHPWADSGGEKTWSQYVADSSWELFFFRISLRLEPHTMPENCGYNRLHTHEGGDFGGTWPDDVGARADDQRKCLTFRCSKVGHFGPVGIHPKLG
jgi:hypothetical protein